jgi:hypothetical protein
MQPCSFRRMLVSIVLVGATAVAPAVVAAALPAGKNWVPPSYRTLAQDLCDRAMADHPELLSITFHGSPPGPRRIYTMFAGSFPERIGNIDGVDDLMVINEGVTIVDPRWQRRDVPRKLVVSLPLRDARGQNIGALVLGFKDPEQGVNVEARYVERSNRIRDDIALRIPSHASLFEAAR